LLATFGISASAFTSLAAACAPLSKALGMSINVKANIIGIGIITSNNNTIIIYMKMEK
jgi:hypothetical protein